jgi:hypothetical protein
MENTKARVTKEVQRDGKVQGGEPPPASRTFQNRAAGVYITTNSSSNAARACNSFLTSNTADHLSRTL